MKTRITAILCRPSQRFRVPVDSKLDSSAKFIASNAWANDNPQESYGGIRSGASKLGPVMAYFENANGIFTQCYPMVIS